MKKSIPTVKERRRREGKTNYHKRLKLLLGRKPRLVVRKSLKNMSAQVITYAPEGDKVVATANSLQLTKNFGMKTHTGNIPSAYLTGLLLGKRAVKAGIKEVICDFGPHRSVKGSRLYATVKGVIDAGVHTSCSEEMLPSEERINGNHIESYAGSVENKDKMFSGYAKEKIDPSKVSSTIADIKKKIENE